MSLVEYQVPLKSMLLPDAHSVSPMNAEKKVLVLQGIYRKSFGFGKINYGKASRSDVP